MKVTKNIKLPKPRRVKLQEREKIKKLIELDKRGLLYKQQKFNGARAFFLNGHLWSRNKNVKGEKICYSDKVVHIVNRLRKIFPNGNLPDGELIIRKTGGGENPRAITAVLNSTPLNAIDIQAEKGLAEFFIFDFLAFNNKWIVNLPYRERMKLLVKHFAKQIKYCPEIRIAISYRLPLKQLLGYASRKRWEGIIVKYKLYKTKVRQHDLPTPKPDGCWKIPFKTTYDFAVIGFGKGKEKTFMKLARYENDEFIDAGKVSNLSAENEKLLKAQSLPFVIELECDEISEKGKPQKPAFIRIRDDKDPTECIIIP